MASKGSNRIEFDSAEVEKNLLKLASFMPQEIANALRAEAEIEATEMKKRTPVAPQGGALRASIIVRQPQFDGFQKHSVAVEAGGPSIPYAIAVHEHPSGHSPPSWEGVDIDWNVPGTGPKYMESVIRESKPFIAQRLMKRINLGKGLA